MLAVRWCVRYIIWQWWKVRFHGNSISGQENGEDFADWTTSTLFRHLKWNLAHMVAVWCSCAKHIFDSGGKCVAMVMAYYAKNWWGNAFQIKFGIHVPLKCSCAWHILGQWRDVRCHGDSVLFQKLKNKTFHKQFKRNWVYMLALRCRCARNFLRIGKNVLPW